MCLLGTIEEAAPGPALEGARRIESAGTRYQQACVVSRTKGSFFPELPKP